MLLNAKLELQGELKFKIQKLQRALNKRACTVKYNFLSNYTNYADSLKAGLQYDANNVHVHVHVDAGIESQSIPT